MLNSRNAIDTNQSINDKSIEIKSQLGVGILQKKIFIVFVATIFSFLYKNSTGQRIIT